jgi:hypothetical protein
MQDGLFGLYSDRRRRRICVGEQHAQTTEGVCRLRVSERAKVKVNITGIGLRGCSNRLGTGALPGSELNGRGTSTSRGREVLLQGGIVVFVVLLSSPPCSSLSFLPSASMVTQAEEKCRRKTNVHVTPV